MKLLNVSDDELNVIKKRPFYHSAYKILNVGLSIHSDDEKIIALFEQMYKRFKTDMNDVPHHFYVVTKESPYGQPFVIAHDEVYLIFGNELIYNHAYMVIFNELKNLFENFYIIHAGVVSRGGKGVVVVGTSSFGKTTLTLELVRKGFNFLSDEFCPIDSRTKKICSFPRGLSLREGSMHILRDIPDKIATLRGDAKTRKKWFDIEDWKEGSMETCVDGKWFFFLRGQSAPYARKGEMMIDILLVKEDNKLIDQLQALPETRLVSRRETEYYIVYRFSFKQGEGLIKRFEEVCEIYPQNILYYEVVPMEEPHFDKEPYVEEIPKSRATLELLKNLINRSQHALIQKEYKTSSLLLLNLGEIVRQVKCYDLFTGRLDRMVELITETVEEQDESNI